MAASALLAATAGLAGAAAAGAPVAAPPAIASYDLDAHLDAGSRSVSGRERITWTNTTHAPTATLCLHLYLNAFRNSETTFLTESAGKHRRWDFYDDPDPWGWIDVASMTTAPAAGAPATPVRFTAAGTIGYAVLPAPAAPGATVALDVEFQARLPRVFARTGYADTARGRFFMVAQWFPKVGVLGDGGWTCDDFHASTEFFADYGNYTVRIDAPAEDVVAAPGEPLAPAARFPFDAAAPPAPGRAVHTFHVAGVHDFAFAAWPGFAERTRAGPGGVEIRLFYPPENESYADRHLDVAARAMADMGARLRPYPYARLTIVDPPFEASGAGGMEYPTLITVWSDRWLPAGGNAAALGVTIHEFAHQYFYGLFASNEPREAWLDEGMATYVTGLVADDLWGADRSALDLGFARLGYFEAARARYVGARKLLDPVLLDAWRYRDLTDYGVASYARTALAMRTLQGIVGDAAMARGLRLYAERAAFTHPSTPDLVRALSDGAGTDLGWFFDAVIRRPGEVDYAAGDVRSERRRLPRGVFPADTPVAGTAVLAAAGEVEPPVWETSIDVERRGDVVLPVDVLAVFEDGTEVRGTWTRDEQLASPSAWRRLTFTTEVPLVRVEVDPDRKLLLDRSFTNNGWARGAAASLATARWGSALLLWVETALQLVAP
ncbi:MAG TPA: M1 family metallopeptidase [Myxococcota bacterium]|nr:M1 family metallopeptidase [Myxococcota bacterium]